MDASASLSGPSARTAIKGLCGAHLSPHPRHGEKRGRKSSSGSLRVRRARAQKVSISFVDEAPVQLTYAYTSCTGRGVGGGWGSGKSRRNEVSFGKRTGTAASGALASGPSTRSPRLKEEDRHLAEVEVDEVLRLVGHVRAEVAPDDRVPGRVVLLVELLLDEGGDILLDVVLLQGLRSAVDRVLLHVLRHVGVLDHSLAVRHLGNTNARESLE